MSKQRKANAIVIPRWMLTAKYCGFVLLGIAAGIAGVPTLSLTTWEGYTSVWAVALAVSAVVAAVASVRVEWEHIEKWGATALVALLSVYTVGAGTLALGDGDAGRLALAVVLLIVTVVPSARAVSLLMKTGLPT